MDPLFRVMAVAAFLVALCALFVSLSNFRIMHTVPPVVVPQVQTQET